jgi:hypothetical protein
MHKGNKIIWVVIFALVVFLTFNKHSKDQLGTYHHTVWADKAGYFIFLPFVLDYHGKVSEVPDSLGSLLGDGFSVDTVNQRLKTKFVTGVALMQLSFYGSAKIYRQLTNEPSLDPAIPKGLDSVTMGFLHVGTALFFTLGLYLLYVSLRIYFSYSASAVSLIGVVFGSNLLHYAIDETLMTHVYSFFWFSVLLYTLIRVSVLQQYSRLIWFMLCLSVGFIVLLRPTNIIYIAAMSYIFLNKQVYYQFLKNQTFEKIVIAFLTVGVLFLPQLIYLNYAFGSFYYNPYQGERFENWLQPKLLEVLFAPNNGLFLYSPILVLTVWGVIKYQRKAEYARWSGAIVVAFVVLTYMTASWWTYDFGCGYGVRNFVEYSTLFVFPIAGLLHHYQGRMRYFMIGAIVFLSVWNTLVMYNYDKCWFGADNWDINYYWNLVVK